MESGKKAKTAGVWFIDGRLIYKAAKDDAQFIQYKKLRALLEDKFDVPLRAIMYFDGASQTDADRKRHNYLSREAGFRIKTFELGRKNFTCPECDHSIETRPQKCVDIALAMSIIAFAAKTEPVSYNPIVFSSGDRDFLPVLEQVRDDYDKDVILFAPRKATASELVAVTTKQIWIEDFYSSVAEPWTTRVGPVSGVALPDEHKSNEMIPAEETLNEAKNKLKEVWNGLSQHEKVFPNNRTGRPWGYMLNNFGTLCLRERRLESLQMFLVEKDEGQWKGANGLCLALAKQVWPGSEIINDAGGHPYLVKPTF